ncbi:MAG: adenine phosphoribosyltransferase [Armatimonadota bacterium]
MDLRTKIRDIPDFPKKGIIFKDITTLLQDKEAFKYSINRLIEHYKDVKIDAIAAVEARGYIFGAAMAYELGTGFIPIRKPGKLPYDTHSMEYELEYGKNTLEIHKDALKDGERILVVDDLVATGGSSRACAQLIEKMGGNVVGFAFLVELTFLKGRDALEGYDVFSLIQY